MTYNETTMSEGKKSFAFKPYTPLSLSIAPNDGYALEAVVCNGEDITAKVVDNTLSFDDPDTDINLIVTFNSKQLASTTF